MGKTPQSCLKSCKDLFQGILQLCVITCLFKKKSKLTTFLRPLHSLKHRQVYNTNSGSFKHLCGWLTPW